jgi:hypothetical protein
LLGDFNTHHPVWGGNYIAAEEQATHLLAATEGSGLQLLTERGTPIWKRNGSISVINLTFSSGGIKEDILFCGPINRWALTQDHLPIEIHIQRTRADSAPPDNLQPLRLDRADWNEINQKIEDSNWDSAECPLIAL